MYSPEFRTAAIQMVCKSGNIAATARRFGISRNTLMNWLKVERPWWKRHPIVPEPEDLFGIDEEVKR